MDTIGILGTTELRTMILVVIDYRTNAAESPGRIPKVDPPQGSAIYPKEVLESRIEGAVGPPGGLAVRLLVNADPTKIKSHTFHLQHPMVRKHRPPSRNPEKPVEPPV